MFLKINNRAKIFYLWLRRSGKFMDFRRVIRKTRGAIG